MTATAASTVGNRHLKLRTSQCGGLTLEPCEDGSCHVDAAGHTSCGRLACPSCGYSGCNLSSQYLPAGRSRPVACSCGHVWIAAGA